MGKRIDESDLRFRRFDDPDTPLAELARPVSATEASRRHYIATACNSSSSTGDMPDQDLGRFQVAMKRRREPTR